MKKLMMLIAFVLMTSYAFADSIDDAEAKQRGVSVEQVQLDHATARIKVLESQVADLQNKLKVALAKSATQPTTTQEALRTIGGVWQEAPGVLLTITQTNGDWSAQSTYTRADVGEIRWEMTGTITPDGAISGTLRHTKAPAAWTLTQTREGKLSDNGNIISGTIKSDTGGGTFTWTRKGAATPQDEAKLDTKQIVQAQSSEKKVVLSVNDFNSLPVFTKISHPNPGPVNFSAIGEWAANGTPMGLTSTSINAVGYVSSGNVVRIIDDSTALVEITLTNPATDIGIPNATRKLIIEGIPTSGQADNTPWSLNCWLKIVATKQYDDTTYFVAEQIVKADKAHPLPSSTGR